MNPTDIDALARLLDGDPTLNGEATEETRALGLLAHYLSATPPVTARPEFKAELRATLVEEARTLAPAPTAMARLRTGIRTTTARWRASARLTAATGAAALALSGGGMAVAADRALPSDALYPAKLVLEDVRIALVRSEVSRGEAHLRQASVRIAEAAAVASGGDQPGAAKALLKADVAARAGAGELLRAYLDEGDLRHVDRLTVFTGVHQLRLAGLGPILAGDAAEAARVVAVALDRIEARLTAMTAGCEACAGLPGGGAGFDFTRIPPAHEDFEACPCELGTSGNAPPGAVEPEADRDPVTVPETPPVDVDDSPPAPQEPPVEPPVVDPPTVEEPDAPAPPERPDLRLPELPELREPLRDGGESVIDTVVRNVLDLFRR